VWILGFAALFAAVLLLAFGLSRDPRAAPPPPPWDVSAVAQRLIYIVGALSGFSVASATFLAGYIERKGPSGFGTVIGMFLIAFIVFVSTAMMLGIIPAKAPDRKLKGHLYYWQHTIFILAICGYYLGLSLSWFALRPFLLALHMDFLADIFTWVLLVTGFLGASRLGLHLYVLTAHPRLSCSLLPVIAFGAAALYRFGLVPFFPGLWPAEHASLIAAIIALGIFAIGFSMDSLMLSLGPKHALLARLMQPGSRALLLYVQAAALAAALIWVTVVAP
jgi:hypothetical protein